MLCIVYHLIEEVTVGRLHIAVVDLAESDRMIAIVCRGWA